MAKQMAAACGLLALAAAACAAPARRPAVSEFAPDRFHFAPLAVEQVGREIPFIFDVPGVAQQAKSNPRTTYEEWIGLGLQALREGDYNVAVDCFRAALAKRPAAPNTVRHLLARALLLDERPREAEKAWEELCQADPADAEAHWQAGFSLFLREEPDAAMRHWAILDELAPAHPYPPLMTGLVQWSLRQIHEAARQIIISTRRNKAPAQAFLAMAAIACETGDLPESVGWMRRGFDRLPPGEQRRWYLHPQFNVLRNTKSGLVASLEREFSLGSETPVEATGTKQPREGLNVVVEKPFAATLDYASMRNDSETNDVPVIESDGLRVLRLAPRIVPK